MKKTAATVNVIEFAEEEILGLVSYWNTPKGNNLAKARFRALCKENSDYSSKEIEAFIEEGSVEQGTWRVAIVHSIKAE